VQLLLFVRSKTIRTRDFASYRFGPASGPFSHPSGSSAAEINVSARDTPFRPSRQRPSRSSGPRKSSVLGRLHSVAKEHWLAGLHPVHPLLGWRQSRIALKSPSSRQSGRRNIRSNQSRGLNNPFPWLRIFRQKSSPFHGFCFAPCRSDFYRLFYQRRIRLCRSATGASLV